jgi:hypothetical protein
MEIAERVTGRAIIEQRVIHVINCPLYLVMRSYHMSHSIADLFGVAQP